jgi:hypothetical protein
VFLHQLSASAVLVLVVLLAPDAARPHSRQRPFQQVLDLHCLFLSHVAVTFLPGRQRFMPLWQKKPAAQLASLVQVTHCAMLAWHWQVRVCVLQVLLLHWLLAEQVVPWSCLSRQFLQWQQTKRAEAHVS